MTKKQTRLEKEREKNVEIEEFPKVEENIEESPKEEEISIENIPKIGKYVTRTWLAKDVLVGNR